jgi:hypothetical protein
LHEPGGAASKIGGENEMLQILDGVAHMEDRSLPVW